MAAALARPLIFAGLQGTTSVIMPKAKDATGASQPLAGRGRKARRTEAAFDLWLQKGLHEIYDQVANEPIPEELLRLIEEDRKR